MKTCGVVLNIKRLDDCENIYKKYLGEDYKISFEDNYSCIVSNHISWHVK